MREILSIKKENIFEFTELVAPYAKRNGPQHEHVKQRTGTQTAKTKFCEFFLFKKILTKCGAE